MLGYLGQGLRRYDLRPIGVHHRRAWEFQAVLSGRIAPVLGRGAMPLRSRTLWVHPPDLVHGWTGEAGREAEVAVVHLLACPAPLRALAESSARRGEPWAVDLDDAQVARVRDLVAGLSPHHLAPTALSPLVIEHAAAELALIALARTTFPPVSASARAEATVAAALAWYDEHLAEGPTLARVAAAVHVSPTHLRRLVHATMGRDPRTVFTERRLATAVKMLEDQDRSVAAVAAACGFGSAAAFVRAVKAATGRTPGSWRDVGRRAVGDGLPRPRRPDRPA